MCFCCLVTLVKNSTYNFSARLRSVRRLNQHTHLHTSCTCQEQNLLECCTHKYYCIWQHRNKSMYHRQGIIIILYEMYSGKFTNNILLYIYLSWNIRKKIYNIDWDVIQMWVDSMKTMIETIYIDKHEVQGPWHSVWQLQLVWHWQFSADLYQNSLLQTKSIEIWVNCHTVPHYACINFRSYLTS